MHKIKVLVTGHKDRHRDTYRTAVQNKRFSQKFSKDFHSLQDLFSLEQQNFKNGSRKCFTAYSKTIKLLGG